MIAENCIHLLCKQYSYTYSGFLLQSRKMTADLKMDVAYSSVDKFFIELHTR
jgi:hypothetical protein